MHINFIKAALIIFIILSSGCALSPVPSGVHHQYLIKQLPSTTTPSKVKSIPVTILVLAVETSPMYQSTQMLYSAQAYQIAYFAQNQWAEPPATMLHNLMLQSLSNTHHFRLVTAPPFSSHYDYMLRTRLLKLEQDYSQKKPMLHLSIQVDIVAKQNNQVIALQLFHLDEPLVKANPYAGVLATNSAVKKWLQALNEFCITQIKKDQLLK